MEQKELLMYSRTSGCPFMTLAKRVLEDYHVPYREIFIDRDTDAMNHVLKWTGFRSVPTLVVARLGEDMPFSDYNTLEAGASPRGIDRGPMITEPNVTQLIAWLNKHGFITDTTEQQP